MNFLRFLVAPLERPYDFPVWRRILSCISFPFFGIISFVYGMFQGFKEAVQEARDKNSDGRGQE